MRKRLCSVVTAVVLASVGVACSAPSSSGDEQQPAPAPAASADASWSDTKATLGVTQWASIPSDNAADTSTQLTGYDDAHQVRAEFVVDKSVDAEGNINVRIESKVQGPAVFEFRALPDQKIEIIQDTFKDHPDARRAFELASANLKAENAAPTGGPLVGTSSVHTLDAPLVGNQEQLICTDSRGRACEKPPSGGDTVRDCVVGAGGLVGTGCLLTGAETIGAGCVISAIAAVAGGLICASDVSQRASCTCVTPCAAQCHQTFNRQYMCPSDNTRSCSSAAANDRVQEASCVRGCGG